MKLVLGLACTGLLAWAAAAAESKDTFQIVTEQTTCPEYGTLLYRRVLLCGNLRLAFEPPGGWKASADPQQHTLLLEAPTADTQIRLRLILPTRSSTNAPPVLPPAPDLKTVVANLAPQAEIVAQGEFPAAGKVGKSCDFNFIQGSRRFQGRVVWVSHPDCHLELVMTTSSTLAQKHPFFIELLNSLDLKSLRPNSQQASIQR